MECHELITLLRKAGNYFGIQNTDKKTFDRFELWVGMDHDFSMRKLAVPEHVKIVYRHVFSPDITKIDIDSPSLSVTATWGTTDASPIPCFTSIDFSRMADAGTTVEDAAITVTQPLFVNILSDILLNGNWGKQPGSPNSGEICGGCGNVLDRCGCGDVRRSRNEQAESRAANLEKLASTVIDWSNGDADEDDLLEAIRPLKG